MGQRGREKRRRREEWREGHHIRGERGQGGDNNGKVHSKERKRIVERSKEKLGKIR